MRKTRSFFAGVLVGALVIAGAGYLKPSGEKGGLINAETQEKVAVLHDMIEEKYLNAGDVKQSAMMDGVLKGYMSGLSDPYSCYYTKQEAKALLEQTEGRFAGIGALMSEDRKTGEVSIAEVYPETPAEKAGLLKGDVITGVDGEDMVGKPIADLVKKVRGEKDTTVTLSILRGSEEKEVKVVRDLIDTPTVLSEMKENHTGYLRIAEFDEVTTKQFEDAMAKLKKDGMTRLIVDLRGNPGGNLDTVVEILRHILPKGKIVTIRDREGRTEVYRSEGKTPLQIPLVVLVNENSASASEIFAGAVKDYGLGTLMGQTTFGKGIVQQLYPLKDGTMVKLTVAEYLTPKGINIHKKGVQPDVKSEFLFDPQNPTRDTQLEDALAYIKNK